MKVFKFFITPVYPYGNDHYYHEMISLAEGLISLGYKVISNVDYWWQPESKSFLLKGDMEADFDVAVYCRRYVLSFEHLLFRKGYPNFDFSKIHVLNDRNDWISPIWHKNKNYRIFDIILAGSLVKGLAIPPNVKPWAIGLTNRIIEQTNKYYNKNEKIEPDIAHNFRVAHNLRERALNELTSKKINFPISACYTTELGMAGYDEENIIDQYYYKATAKRQHPDYFRFINSHLMFLAFCGYLEYKPKYYQPYSYWQKVMRKMAFIKSKFISDPFRTQFVFQHDSFRFWEVMLSRSCPITLNYKSWGLILPKVPEEGIHYLGVNKFEFEDFSKKINSLSTEEIKLIGLNGRKWVLENYSPIAQANRFLMYLSE